MNCNQEHLEFWQEALLVVLNQRALRLYGKALLLATHKDPHMDGEVWEALRAYLAADVDAEAEDRRGAARRLISGR